MASEIVAFYATGVSVREVAKAFNVHRQTATRHLHAAGVQTHRRRLDAIQITNACELYAAGKTLAQVGKHFGVSQGTVGRLLRANGVELRPPLARAVPELIE